MLHILYFIAVKYYFLDQQYFIGWWPEFGGLLPSEQPINFGEIQLYARQIYTRETHNSSSQVHINIRA